MPKRSDAEWQQLLSEYQQSNLSQKAFCKQKHICPKGLSRYRRQVGECLSTPRFVQVKHPVPITHPTVKVELGNLKVYLPLEPTLPTAQLIKALQ